jgi:hypothetical protein
LLCSLLHNPGHARQRVLNLGTIGHVTGCELVPAETAGQISPELKLPQPDFEQLLAVRTDKIDPCAPVIFEQAASPVKVHPQARTMAVRR